MNHYTYLLFNGSLYYIGVRSCHTSIEDDYEYLGSCSNDEFNSTIKTKTILSYHETREDAFKTEGYWHELFQVHRNELFANKVRSTNFKDLGVVGINTRFPKGLVPWNKGKKMSKEYCEMAKENATGVVQTEKSNASRAANCPHKSLERYSFYNIETGEYVNETFYLLKQVPEALMGVSAGSVERLVRKEYDIIKGWILL